MVPKVWEGRCLLETTALWDAESKEAVVGALLQIPALKPIRVGLLFFITLLLGGKSLNTVNSCGMAGWAPN